jgi:taurine--2-oxoglutarate transaminase
LAPGQTKEKKVETKTATLTSDEIREEYRRYVLHPWSVQAEIKPLAIVGGKGATLWDAEGRRFVDFSAQLANVGVGYQDPRVVDALVRQARELCYVSGLHAHPLTAQLARRIAERMPGNLARTYFTVGGSEANEVAIQIARMVTGRPKIISRYRSYHGATYGALSATGTPGRLAAGLGIAGALHALEQDCYRCPFGQHYPGCHIECAEQFDHLIQLEGPDQVAAIIVEPVGTGVLIPPPEYLPKLRQICDRHGVLLIFDEVVSGFGRSGKWFACEHWDVVPDIMTVAKGLNSGYGAIGATVVSAPIADYFETHLLPMGFTNGGQPLAFAAALAVLDVIEEDHLVERSAALGQIAREELARLQANHDCIGDARSLGLWGAIELVIDRATKEPLASPLRPTNTSSPGPLDALRAYCLDHGLLLRTGASNITFSPPLCMSEEELRRAFAILDEGLALL